MVLKTTFEQSQRWSYYRNFTVRFWNRYFDPESFRLWLTKSFYRTRLFIRFSTLSGNISSVLNLGWVKHHISDLDGIVSAFCGLQNQNQNSLLVTHQLTYIHQGQRMRGLFSRSHQWCESRDAILRGFSRGYSRCRECIPISNSFRKETMPISISPSIWDLKWFRMLVSSIP